jgi:hypothetical protein
VKIKQAVQRKKEKENEKNSVCYRNDWTRWPISC